MRVHDHSSDLDGGVIAATSSAHGDLTGVTADQHHAKYTDGEAVSAMGAKGDANPLNHDRYTDAEAVSATAAAYEAAGAIATHATDVDAHHAKYTDGEAVAAVAATLADHELDYAELTSNKTITATTEAGANTVLAGASVTYDGSTPVIVEFYSELVRGDTSGTVLYIYLYEDSASIGRLAYIDAAAGRIPVHVARRLTPSSGAHTYTVKAAVASGSGVVSGGAGGSGNSMPGFLRITRANPSVTP